MDEAMTIIEMKSAFMLFNPAEDDFDYFETAGNGIFAKKTMVGDTGLIVDTSPEAPSIILT